MPHYPFAFFQASAVVYTCEFHADGRRFSEVQASYMEVFPNKDRGLNGRHIEVGTNYVSQNNRAYELELTRIHSQTHVQYTHTHPHTHTHTPTLTYTHIHHLIV